MTSEEKLDLMWGEFTSVSGSERFHLPQAVKFGLHLRMNLNSK